MSGLPADRGGPLAGRRCRQWMARDRSGASPTGRGGSTRFDLDAGMVLELGWAVRDTRTGVPDEVTIRKYADIQQAAATIAPPTRAVR